MTRSFAVAFVANLVLASQCVAQDLILGALEDVPGVYAGEGHKREVRVLFHKEKNEWIAFPRCDKMECLTQITSKYPKVLHWTVAFDGKNLGQIEGKTPTDFKFYSYIGLQKITSANVPSVGQRARVYSGFLDTPVLRPLVTISQPNFKDPDSWKAHPVSAAKLSVLRQSFRKKFPKLCRVSQDETKLEPLPYRPENVALAKSYQSDKGWILGQLDLKDAVECDNDEDGSPMGDPWFMISSKGNVTFIGGDIWLVDAGDYDADGHSELLFSIAGDNRAGYLLIYGDEYKKKARFDFSYH